MDLGEPHYLEGVGRCTSAPTVGQQAAPPVAPSRDFQGQASLTDNANEIVAHYARTKARIFF